MGLWVCWGICVHVLCWLAGLSNIISSCTEINTNIFSQPSLSLLKWVYRDYVCCLFLSFCAFQNIGASRYFTALRHSAWTHANSWNSFCCLSCFTIRSETFRSSKLSQTACRHVIQRCSYRVCMKTVTGCAWRQLQGVHEGSYRVCMKTVTGYAWRQLQGMREDSYRVCVKTVTGYAWRQLQGMREESYRVCMKTVAGYAWRQLQGMHEDSYRVCMKTE